MSSHREILICRLVKIVRPPTSVVNVVAPGKIEMSVGSYIPSTLVVNVVAPGKIDMSVGEHSQASYVSRECRRTAKD